MTRPVGSVRKSVFTADSREQASIGQTWVRTQIKYKPSVGPAACGRQEGELCCVRQRGLKDPLYAVLGGRCPAAKTQREVQT